MNTKILSEKTMALIDQYKNFTIGSATCSIPYYNNRHLKLRAGLRAENGKGSPKDISDELQSLIVKEKIDLKILDSLNLKRFLVDHDIGIDCSGLAYYILDKEYGSIDKHLFFPFCNGLVGKIRSKMRPVENTGVSTLAFDKNSKVIQLKEARPGDIITMLGGEEEGDRDHILVIYQIDYQNFIPIKIYYVHSVTWPTDGEYGHGISEGSIEINDPEKTIEKQVWLEKNVTGNDNYTFARALRSKTEMRRLIWL